MAFASPFALEEPQGVCSWILFAGDSLAIVGSALTVLYTCQRISLRTQQLMQKSNPNNFEETNVSDTANRFQPWQIRTANLLVLHAALWAIVRSATHLTFATKQYRRNTQAFDSYESNIYQLEWWRSDTGKLWNVVQTFTWGTLCLTTASLGVSLAMLAMVDVIMVSLLLSMFRIQGNATREKVEGREIKILNDFVKGTLGFLVVSIVFVTAMCVMTLPMLLDWGGIDSMLYPSGPGLIKSNLTVDMIGFMLEISAVQFFQVWLLVTTKRLESCPIDEWTMRQEEVRHEAHVGSGPRGTLCVLTRIWTFGISSFMSYHR
ncbi:hypothetical protein NEUTE2DRAFT_140465 [Neurospora tetrasperma FGSC 2509]|nr:hypothetical protein NEUTE2DRAFT_140465 [Neurospora tetrasperma FGSC 2509]